MIDPLGETEHTNSSIANQVSWCNLRRSGISVASTNLTDVTRDKEKGNTNQTDV